jgi:hypothetical protein
MGGSLQPPRVSGLRHQRDENTGNPDGAAADSGSVIADG